MKTLTVITSTEYHLNQSSIFTIIDGNYYGCLIYPNFRNFPVLDYWRTSTSSDSDRGFSLIEKEFSDEEVLKITTLQNVINSLSKLIPSQNFPYIYSSCFKIKKGKKYQEYKAAKTAQEIEIKNYFDSIRIFDNARSKAFNGLRNILNK